MTVPELDALPAGTMLYLPTEWEVLTWRFVGRVYDRSFYTLLHGPDKDGVIYNRRPVYMDALQLMPSTLDETTAWYIVLAGLEERIDWIQKRKISQSIN